MRNHIKIGENCLHQTELLLVTLNLTTLKMDITEKKEITFYVVYKFLHIFNEILKNKLLLLSSCRVSAKS